MKALEARSLSSGSMNRHCGRRHRALDPASRPRNAWSGVVALFIVYTIVIVPYRISFLQVRRGFVCVFAWV
jgi:hypothetical protein